MDHFTSFSHINGYITVNIINDLVEIYEGCEHRYIEDVPEEVTNYCHFLGALYDHKIAKYINVRFKNSNVEYKYSIPKFIWLLITNKNLDITINPIFLKKKDF